MSTTVEVVVPDVMGDLRTALRALPDLADTTAGNVFYATPVGAKFPLIRLSEAGLTPQPGETPVWTQRVLIEVITNSPSDYFKVSKAKNIITSWLWALTGQIGSSTRVLDGTVDTVTDLPDPDTGAPRKVISAVLTVIAL